MMRSGLLVVLVVSALVGCSAPPPAAPTPVSPPTTPAVVVTCPQGLTSALRSHLLTQPWEGELPVDATVDSPPNFAFASSVLASIVGCSFTTEIQLASGDRVYQIFGIADGLDEAGVLAIVEEAGWEPVGIDPSAWQDPDVPEEGVHIFPRGISNGNPALDFPNWDDYLRPDDVLLLGSIAA